MISRLFLLSRSKLLPGLLEATLYRVQADGTIAASASVSGVRYRENSVSESPSQWGPSRSEQATISFYSESLGDWELCENDIVKVLCPDTQGTYLPKWFRVASIRVKLLGTIFECVCNRATELEQ
jgi:hypothetical protein